MNQALKTFLQEEKGTTAIEYGLIAGLIAVAIITAATDLGSALSSIFDGIKTKLTGITVP